MRQRSLQARGLNQVMTTSDGKIEAKEVILEPHIGAASSVKTNSTAARIQKNSHAYPDLNIKFG